jgi:hypothetical protein
MEKGSMLVLAIIATMILSLILVAGLTVSTTEVHTTQNNLMKKLSYYKAVEGVEVVIEDIRNTLNPDLIASLRYGLDNIYVIDDLGTSKLFITGSLGDLQALKNETATIAPAISQFNGFPAPPFPGMSLGTSTGVSPIIWMVPITAEVKTGKKTAYTEIEAGIYSILLTGY